MHKGGLFYYFSKCSSSTNICQNSWHFRGAWTQGEMTCKITQQSSAWFAIVSCRVFNIVFGTTDLGKKHPFYANNILSTQKNLLSTVCLRFVHGWCEGTFATVFKRYTHLLTLFSFIVACTIVANDANPEPSKLTSVRGRGKINILCECNKHPLHKGCF